MIEAGRARAPGGERDARVAGTRQTGAELAELVAPLWTADHTSAVLRMTGEQIRGERRQGRLLGVETGEGDVFYPVWQFERFYGRVRVKPAVRTFTTVLRSIDPWTVAVLLRTPAPELDDTDPLSWAAAERDDGKLAGYAAQLLAELTH